MHTSFFFHADTTDVQVVAATQIEGVNTTIQCEFITGSNATGCMVVLTNEEGQKVQYNLTRNQSTNLATLTVTLELPLSCYDGVEAFDIESDGSVGSLTVPGQIINSSQAPCSPPEVSSGNNMAITTNYLQL